MNTINNTTRAKWLSEDIAKYSQQKDWGLVAMKSAELAAVSERLDSGFEDERELKQ